LKFLVDAQRPVRLARLLKQSGYDALHTVSLPDGNRTTDSEIISIAGGDDRVALRKIETSETAISCDPPRDGR
jgi:predicted nuclease of predicted toxin-antitoxin system